MLRYILYRLALIPITLLGISFLVFALSRFLPGGLFERQLAAEMSQALQQGYAADISRFSQQQLADLRSYYGLGESLGPAYFHWLHQILQLDLGMSLRYQEPVWKLLADRLPISTMFGLSGLIFSYGFCVPLGLILAFKPRSLFSILTSFGILAVAALPAYVFATLLFLFGAARWEWFPIGGLVSDSFSELSSWAQLLDIAHHAALPLLSYLAGQAAVLSFLMRNSLDEHLASECIRGARAKGADAWQALWRHALPLSILPLISQFGQHLALLLAGSFIVERIFNIDGMGLLAYEALVERDYPLMLGMLVLVSLLHLLGNLLSDLCLAWADPRIRWGER